MSTGTTAKVAALVWIPSAVIDRALIGRTTPRNKRYRRHASRYSRGRDDIQRNPQAAAENMNPCHAKTAQQTSVRATVAVPTVYAVNSD